MRRASAPPHQDRADTGPMPGVMTSSCRAAPRSREVRTCGDDLCASACAISSGCVALRRRRPKDAVECQVGGTYPLSGDSLRASSEVCIRGATRDGGCNGPLGSAPAGLSVPAPTSHVRSIVGALPSTLAIATAGFACAQYPMTSPAARRKRLSASGAAAYVRRPGDHRCGAKGELLARVEMRSHFPSLSLCESEPERSKRRAAPPRRSVCASAPRCSRIEADDAPASVRPTRDFPLQAPWRRAPPLRSAQRRSRCAFAGSVIDVRESKS